MQNWFRRLFPLGLLFWSTGQGSEPAEPLDELRWASRVLLVFAVDDQDPRVIALGESIREAHCAVAERDLVFGRVFLTGASRIGENTLGGETAARLRDRFQLKEPDFRVLLIGKDGGVKSSYNSVPDLDDVFRLIDSMPMRIREAKSQSTPCSGQSPAAVHCPYLDQDPHAADPYSMVTLPALSGILAGGPAYETRNVLSWLNWAVLRQRAHDDILVLLEHNVVVRLKNVSLYLGLGMLFTHEMDAMPNHEWRVFPLLGSLPDAAGQSVFLAAHIPIFALVIAFVASLNLKVRNCAQKIAAGFLIVHAVLHFMFSGQANYEFSSFFSGALILGAALCGIGFFSAVALERSSTIS